MSVPTFERAKARYQDVGVAEGYDSWRYETARGRRRNARDLAAMGRAVEAAAARGAPIGSALDVPCGTGRLVPWFADRRIAAVGGDVSLAMVRVARRKCGGSVPLYVGSAAALPHRDGSVDAVFAIRFMFHLDAPARHRTLVEMRRVARRWLVVDFRHRYNARYLGWRIRRAVRLLPAMQFRFSRRGLEEELRAAGLGLAGIYPSRRVFGWLSDKWIVLAEKLGS